MLLDDFVFVVSLMLGLNNFAGEVFTERGVGALGMSTRVGELCVC